MFQKTLLLSRLHTVIRRQKKKSGNTIIVGTRVVGNNIMVKTKFNLI